MNTEIKKYADSGDIKSLKYIFVDALDVDPTFVRYEEEYNYCKSIPGLLESYVELTPFRESKADWNEEYWTNLKMDLVKNFSDKRMSHMREVAQVFLADKVQRILAERAANNSNQKTSATKAETVSEKNPEEPMRRTPISKADYDRGLEEKKRKLKEVEEELETKRKESVAKSEQLRREQEQESQTGVGFSKKTVGVAAAVVTVAVVLILLLK